MAAAPEDLPEEQDDITSLSEYRRSDRQAAFTRVVEGYMLKAVPVIEANGGQLRVYCYTPGAQGPLHGSALEMDDTTRENLGLPVSVQEAFNELLNREFIWPPALA